MALPSPHATAQTVRPLAGLRVLAIEQMQALPFATQLLARLGADVVKVEPPGRGDTARASKPAASIDGGDEMGATFLRNNLGKRSITVNLKHQRGRDLVLALARKFDIVAENSRPGVMERLGLGYKDVAAVHPACIYVSVSGFGNLGESPYRDWPALAPVVEAMTGVHGVGAYEGPPRIAPLGAVGDISAALFATIGILTAVIHRERTGDGQYIDIAMLDSMIAMTDIVTNLWSLGLRDGSIGPVIMHAFRAADGWFVLQVTREHQFESLAHLLDRTSWLTDDRFVTRAGWVEHLDTELRPAIEQWASTRTKVEAAALLAQQGLPAGPCLSPEDLVHDAHVRARNMLVALPRTGAVTEPVLVPGNPVKLAGVPDGPDAPCPALGRDTGQVLRDELGLSKAQIQDLRAEGAI